MNTKALEDLSKKCEALGIRLDESNRQLAASNTKVDELSGKFNQLNLALEVFKEQQKGEAEIVKRTLEPLQKLVYGLVALVLAAVGSAVVSGIIK